MVVDRLEVSDFKVLCQSVSVASRCAIDYTFIYWIVAKIRNDMTQGLCVYLVVLAARTMCCYPGERRGADEATSAR